MCKYLDLRIEIEAYLYVFTIGINRISLLLAHGIHCANCKM